MKWKRRGMVFMMNDFKAYLRYYVNSNKRLLVLVFIILFLIMPFLTFNYMGLPHGSYSLDTFYMGFIALGAATCARSPRPSSAGLRSFLRWRCRSVSWRAFAASSWSALSACSSRRRPPRRSTWRSRWTPTRIWPGIWWCSPPCFPY